MSSRNRFNTRGNRRSSSSNTSSSRPYDTRAGRGRNRVERTSTRRETAPSKPDNKGPKKGDVRIVNNVRQVYDGTKWVKSGRPRTQAPARPSTPSRQSAPARSSTPSRPASEAPSRPATPARSNTPARAGSGGGARTTPRSGGSGRSGAGGGRRGENTASNQAGTPSRANTGGNRGGRNGGSSSTPSTPTTQPTPPKSDAPKPAQEERLNNYGRPNRISSQRLREALKAVKRWKPKG